MSQFRFLIVGLMFSQLCAAQSGELDMGFTKVPRLTDRQIELIPADKLKQSNCDYIKLYVMHYLAEIRAERNYDTKSLDQEVFDRAMKNCQAFTPAEVVMYAKEAYAPGGLAAANQKLFDSLEVVAKAWEVKTKGHAEAKRPVALTTPEIIREQFAPGKPAALALNGLFPNQPLPPPPPNGAQKAVDALKNPNSTWKYVAIGGVALLAIFGFMRFK